ncbi:MAG: alginate lyase family protein [Akkermansiaceae bacterium]|nr:alginate lyase family protein [Akkermansiaceae bacterium]
MSSIARYWRTLRHLKLAQVLGQVTQRLGTRGRDPSKTFGQSWTLSPNEDGLSIYDPVPPQQCEKLSKGLFNFVGHAADLGSPPDWSSPDQSKLWQYNLHYFDWLWTLLPEEAGSWNTARTITLDWIKRYPANKSSLGWDPYPTSLRLINWTLLFGIRHRGQVDSDQEFSAALLESLGKQVRYLEGSLETHLQGNHLLENLVALTLVSSILQGSDRDRLAGFAVPKLRRELSEQILSDGMHYERSPMYHLRILWLMEVLSQVGAPEIHDLAADQLPRMRSALHKLSHPDGEISQFNDSALGIYTHHPLKQGQPGAWGLPKAGYYGFRSEAKDYLIIDAGAIGPDYQPGHAHADLLSFELSLAGNRVISDTGVGTYDPSAQRSYARSTAAHATVEVGGENSVEVWGSFRVGRRTEPRILKWEEFADGCLLEAEHRGYAHRPSHAVHHRRFHLSPGKLLINDRLILQDGEHAIGRIPLAPGVKATLEGNLVRCHLGDFTFAVTVAGAARVTLENAMSWPQFGQGQERCVIALHIKASAPKEEWSTTIAWDPETR